MMVSWFVRGHPSWWEFKVGILPLQCFFTKGVLTKQPFSIHFEIPFFLAPVPTIQCHQSVQFPIFSRDQCIIHQLPIYHYRERENHIRNTWFTHERLSSVIIPFSVQLVFTAEDSISIPGMSLLRFFTAAHLILVVDNYGVFRENNTLRVIIFQICAHLLISFTHEGTI